MLYSVLAWFSNSRSSRRFASIDWLSRCRSLSERVGSVCVRDRNRAMLLSLLLLLQILLVSVSPSVAAATGNESVSIDADDSEFDTGQSNPTYVLQVGCSRDGKDHQDFPYRGRFVLRKKPPVLIDPGTSFAKTTTARFSLGTGPLSVIGVSLATKVWIPGVAGGESLRPSGWRTGRFSRLRTLTLADFVSSGWNRI